MRYAPNTYEVIEVCDWSTALLSLVEIGKCQLLSLKDVARSLQVPSPADLLDTAQKHRWIWTCGARGHD